MFNVPRAEQIPNVLVKVEPAFDSSNLKNSKTLKVWEYERQIEEIEKKEQERSTEWLKEKEQKVSKPETDAQKALEKVEKNQGSFSTEVLFLLLQCCGYLNENYTELLSVRFELTTLQ